MKLITILPFVALAVAAIEKTVTGYLYIPETETGVRKPLGIKSSRLVVDSDYQLFDFYPDLGRILVHYKNGEPGNLDFEKGKKTGMYQIAPYNLCVYKGNHIDPKLDAELDGKLVLENAPNKHFSMKYHSSKDLHKYLYYLKQDHFQLCGDGSIGFDSKCAGARKVKIAFDELIGGNCL
ncbi:hypothetical protein JCM33374_g5906 [Metschnikowia sp. JCM 33374]|nr:hypothetical protein JCM33374_g5906 [Metschnikowia sp. JCM 33374]